MNFATVYEQADAAGKAAAAALKPVPMVVGQAVGIFSNEIDYSKPTYFVEDGVCGFAWVAFKGNTEFGRWAKKNKIAKPGYPSGLQIWISDYNQSMQLKEAYAKAFAETLRANGVADAYYSSRMD